MSFSHPSLTCLVLRFTSMHGPSIFLWSIQRSKARMSKISTCCRNPRQDWPALKARWMSSQSRCCFRTTRPEIQSLKSGDKMSFKGFWLTSALSSSLSPQGDTYIGVGKSFKALAKFFALHTFALVVGPRVCGIFSISLKQKNIESPSTSVSSMLSKSPCTQRGRIHCNTLLCCRLGFWKRPFLAKHCLGSATDNVQQSHFDLWNVI